MVPGAARQMTAKILILLYYDTKISIRTKADTNIKFFPQSNRYRQNYTNKSFSPYQLFRSGNRECAKALGAHHRHGPDDFRGQQENTFLTRRGQRRKDRGRKSGPPNFLSKSTD